MSRTRLAVNENTCMPAVHFIHDPCDFFIHSCARVGSRWGQDGGVKIFAKVDAQTNLCEAAHREISAPWLCGKGDCDYTLLTPSAEREDDSCCQPPACPSLPESHHSRARVCSLCHCCCQSRPWCLAAPPCLTLWHMASSPPPHRHQFVPIPFTVHGMEFLQ